MLLHWALHFGVPLQHSNFSWVMQVLLIEMVRLEQVLQTTFLLWGLQMLQPNLEKQILICF